MISRHPKRGWKVVLASLPAAVLRPNFLFDPARNFVSERFDLIAVGAFDKEARFGFGTGIAKQDATLAVEPGLDFLDELHHVGKRVPGGLILDPHIDDDLWNFVQTRRNSLSDLPVSIMMRSTWRALTMPSPVVV